MSTFYVRCQSAAGAVTDVRVSARSESSACAAALRRLPSSDGWRAVYALELSR